MPRARFHNVKYLASFGATMTNRGFVFDLMDQTENGGRIHQELISRIEAVTKRTLVVYFANPGHPGGAMVDADPDLLENILRSLEPVADGRKLDLLISSPGGSPYAAEKIVRVCRSFSTGFRSVVIGRAMSAATMLCLGSDELIMSETANLGPIDPQMLQVSANGQQRLVAASVIISSFQQMLGAAQQAITNGQPADPILHVLGMMDPKAVIESINALEATKSISTQLLKEGLLKSQPAKADAAVQALVEQGAKELHGKHLYPKYVQSSIGLPVTILPVGSELDVLLRELAVRVEMYATRKMLAKYIVALPGGVDINVAVAAVVRGG